MIHIPGPEEFTKHEVRQILSNSKAGSLSHNENSMSFEVTIPTHKKFPIAGDFDCHN